MQTTPQKLGQFLKDARQRKNLTLRAVESATEISNAYLSQLESGRIQQPSPMVLYKLSKLYGISYADTMRYAGYPVPGEQERDSELRRPLARFGEITEEEEAALSEYLEFLRAKQNRRSR